MTDRCIGCPHIQRKTWIRYASCWGDIICRNYGLLPLLCAGSCLDLCAVTTVSSPRHHFQYAYPYLFLCFVEGATNRRNNKHHADGSYRNVWENWACFLLGHTRSRGRVGECSKIVTLWPWHFRAMDANSTPSEPLRRRHAFEERELPLKGMTEVLCWRFFLSLLGVWCRSRFLCHKSATPPTLVSQCSESCSIIIGTLSPFLLLLHSALCQTTLRDS